MEYFKNLGFDVGKGKYYEEVVYGVALLYNVINNEISSYLNSFNLSPAKFNILMVLEHQGGKNGLSQVEISKRLIVTASNTTRLLDKLEKEKLIQRVAQEGDRRVNIIQISEKGSVLLDRAWPGYVGKLQNLISKLNKNSQKEISQLLLKWFAKLVEE